MIHKALKIFPGLEPSVALYRLLHPESRVVDHCKLYGSSGVIRRVTCIYCGSLITSSNAWPETKRSLDFRKNHKACAEEFLKIHLSKKNDV